MSSSHFDAIAEVYDASLPAHVVEHYLTKRVRFVADHCPPGTGLDVGCGTGVLAERLARRGFAMTGIDPSEGMLEIMRRRTDLVTGVQGSGTELPFGADSFDLVLSVAVMHHIADPVDCARDAGRDGAGGQAWRHGPDLGSQSAQPVLGAADGPGAPGRRL